MTFPGAQQIRLSSPAQFESAAAARLRALPTADELVAAIQGNKSSNHPVAELANLLGTAHRQRIDHSGPITEIDGQRAELIVTIDAWVNRNVPSAHAGPTLHTECLGPVVDRMAERQVQTQLAADAFPRHSADARRAHNRLAEITDAYDALVAEVLGGKRRLPRASVATLRQTE